MKFSKYWASYQKTTAKELNRDKNTGSHIFHPFLVVLELRKPPLNYMAQAFQSLHISNSVSAKQSEEYIE